MPTKKRRPRRTDTRLALHKRLSDIHAEITRLKRDRAAVNRAEFVEVTHSLRQLEKNTEDLAEHATKLATQFTRMSQIQQEVDAIKRALKKAGLLD